MKRAFQTGVGQLLCMLCVLYGCSDNTTSTPQFQDVVPLPPPPVSGPVAVELFQTSRLLSPLPNPFTVIVHTAEAGGEDEIIRVEEGGRRELGEITGTLSLTIVYNDDAFWGFTGGPSGNLALRSFIDIPLQDLEKVDDLYVLKVPIRNDFNELERASPNMQLTIESDAVSELQGTSSSAVYSKLQPTDEGRPRSCSKLIAGQTVDNKVRVYESQLQDDGNLSYLSFVSESAMAVLRSYGFELDVTPGDDLDIRIEANLQPADLVVRALDFPLLLPDGSDRDSNAAAIEIYGERKGVSYRLSEEASISHSNTGFLSRILPCSVPEKLVFPATLGVAAEFPVDDYIIQRRQFSRFAPAPETASIVDPGLNADFLYSTRHECVLRERMAELPSELVVSPPRMSYTELVFDAESRRVSWSNIAADQIKNQTLRVQSRSSGFLARSIWTIRIVDNRTSFVLPFIPQEVIDEIYVEPEPRPTVGTSVAGIIVIDEPELYVTISGYDYARPLVEPRLYDFEQSFPEVSGQSCNRSATVFIN